MIGGDGQDYHPATVGMDCSLKFSVSCRIGK